MAVFRFFRIGPCQKDIGREEKAKIETLKEKM
jgi:hypothetical protein